MTSKKIFTGPQNKRDMTIHVNGFDLTRAGAEKLAQTMDEGNPLKAKARTVLWCKWISDIVAPEIRKREIYRKHGDAIGLLAQALA